MLLHRTARNWQAVQKAYNFLLRTVLSSVCKMWVCQSFLFCWFDVDMQIAHRHTHTHTRYVAVRSCKLGEQECETLLPCCNKFFIFKPQVPYKNQIITGMVTFVAVDDCAMGALGYSSVLQICRGGGQVLEGGPFPSTPRAKFLRKQEVKNCLHFRGSYLWSTIVQQKLV